MVARIVNKRVRKMKPFYKNKANFYVPKKLYTYVIVYPYHLSKEILTWTDFV